MIYQVVLEIQQQDLEGLGLGNTTNVKRLLYVSPQKKG